MNLCLSISTQESQRWHTLLRNEPLVELRCDLMGISPLELAEIAPLAKRVIVTCHTDNLSRAEDIYIAAIGARVWAVDIALTMQPRLRQRLIEEACRAGVKVILSHHYTSTPSHEELIARAEEVFASGGDIAKIITTATTTAEALVPLELYNNHFHEESIIAFAMGEKGLFSRRLSLLLGAPHTYTAPSEEERTAKGQPTIDEMQKMLCEGEFLGNLTLPHSVVPPSSKSEAQRAIILATLCRGTTIIENYTPCSDTLTAERVAKALGATITQPTPTTLSIEGGGLEGVRRALQQTATLLVGESALLTRLLMPIVALLYGASPITLQGTGSLCGRDFGDDIATLLRYGAHTTSNNGKMPTTIHSLATPQTTVEIDGSGSSQSISGWMMALGAIGGSHTLKVKNATSRPYIALSAKMMELFGAEIAFTDSAEELLVDITSNGYRPTRVRLTTDWSGAANFAIAYAIAQSGWASAEKYALQATTGTKQGDEAIVDILRSVGARMEITQNEVRFLPSDRLGAFCYDATDTPDLIPPLAVLALFCEGCSRIGGLHRLANKESNRTEAIIENLVVLGARVTIEGNELVVEGLHPLHSAPLRSHNDHRIVMAMTIAALFVEKKPTIDSVECVAKSYPDFFEQLKG